MVAIQRVPGSPPLAKAPRLQRETMKFIEMNGKLLVEVVDIRAGDAVDLHDAGVDDDTIVRVNQQGDIEVRRRERWDVVGGLIGNFEDRLKETTGLDWA